MYLKKYEQIVTSIFVNIETQVVEILLVEDKDAFILHSQ